MARRTDGRSHRQPPLCQTSCLLKFSDSNHALLLFFAGSFALETFGVFVEMFLFSKFFGKVFGEILSRCCWGFLENLYEFVVFFGACSTFWELHWSTQNTHTILENWSSSSSLQWIYNHMDHISILLLGLYPSGRGLLHLLYRCYSFITTTAPPSGWQGFLLESSVKKGALKISSFKKKMQFLPHHLKHRLSDFSAILLKAIFLGPLGFASGNQKKNPFGVASELYHRWCFQNGWNILYRT